LNKGLVEEVEKLLIEGLKPEQLIYYGLEYKYITLYLTREIKYDEMFNKLNIAIRQFAKRQMTWFRKMEKEGAVIHWLDEGLPFGKKLQMAISLAGY
jgi:tRNA dimethylallyltransferase